MNWIYSLIVFQYTILLLQGRPETSTSSMPEKITLEMEHPSSVSEILTTLESSPPPEIVSPDTKKHLSANVAVSIPSQTTKRVMSTTQSRKNEPIKKATKTPEMVSTSSSSSSAFPTASSDIDFVAKTTRYGVDVDQSREIMNAKQLTTNNVYKSQLILNNPSLLRQLKQQQINRINRQYLANVYSFNPNSNQFFAQVLSTPKSIQAILAPDPEPEPILSPNPISVAQSTYYLVDPNGIDSIDNIQTNANSFLTYENQFNPHYVSSETYQVPRPPLTVNIPYHEFPTPSPPLLINSANITKLYSIIGSSTPDPYNNYQALPTKPSTTRRKVVQFTVTTHRSVKYTHKKGQSPSHNTKNSHKNNQNHYSEQHHHHHHYHDDSHENYNENHKHAQNNVNKKHESGTGQFNNNNQNDVNKISIVYNESSQIYSTNDNRKPININTGNLNKNESNAQSTTKECLVTPNLANPQLENVCKSNYLNILIKFDGTNIPNATEKNEVKPKAKKKKPTTTTTTTTTTVAPDSSSYESDEIEKYDDDDEEEEEDEQEGDLGIFEPIQGIFDFLPSNRARRRRRKRPNKNKDKNKHGQKSSEVINKFQTIVLQSPAPPTAPPESDKHEFHLSKKSLLKLLALIPLFGLLKPFFFGIWTIVLSPILVIAIGGLALGVVLYPFLAISRKQIYYASSQRSPRIVIHKHPTSRYGSRVPAQGIRIAKWNSGEKRRNYTPQNLNHHRRFYNGIHPKRIIPIQYRKYQPRSIRQRRDTQFQQWLLIQNNFNIRIMSPNHELDYH